VSVPALASLSALLPLLCLSCLPIPHSVPVSPALVGIYRADDGPPLTGRRIVIAKDSTCAAPTASAVTDSVGAFAFAGTRHRYSYIILLPYDPVAPSYFFCAGTPDSLRPIFQGQNYSTSLPDTLVCTETRQADLPRTRCRGWLK